MTKYNERQVSCTCYEEIKNIIFIPDSEQLIINTQTVMLSPENEEVGRETKSETASLPADNVLLDVLLSYRVDDQPIAAD